jgi:ribosomal 50S subunit-associated protein YjgA (DUF615 family)
LHPLQEDYWDLFWKLYTTQRESPTNEPPKASREVSRVLTNTATFRMWLRM